MVTAVSHDIGDKQVGRVPAADGRTERILRLRPDPSAPQRARDFVAETFSVWRLGGCEETAVLITSELVTNAVRHAGTDVTVRIARASSGSEVRIDVVDQAGDRDLRVGAADSGAAGKAGPAGTAGGVGGVGLVIVERLAGEWGVEKRRDGKSVWARLAVDPARGS